MMMIQIDSLLAIKDDRPGPIFGNRPRPIMGDCPAPPIDDWGRSLMDDWGTSIIGDRGSRPYVGCHKNSNSFERPERATRRMNPLLSKELMQHRACGMESAT
jgi:hypothetical protein